MCEISIENYKLSVSASLVVCVVVVAIDEWKYMMFVWKDECGESESIRVVWCDLSVWDTPGQKKERMREMYARTAEREHGDEKTNVIGKMPSWELDRRETWV